METASRNRMALGHGSSHVRLLSLLFIGCTALAFVSCAPTVESGFSSANGRPITVHFADGGAKEIRSFQADVEQYSGIDRTGGAMRKVQGYRLAQKTINGKILLRIDYSGDAAAGLAARTVISNAEECVIYNHDLRSFEMRVPAQDLGAALGFSGASAAGAASLMGRIPNVSSLVEEFRRLSYDVGFDTEKQGYSITMPSSAIQTPATAMKPLSLRLFLDAAGSVISGTEAVFQAEDGSLMTSVQTPIYEEREGILVQVGEVTEVKRDLPEGAPVPRLLPSAEEMAEAPKITEEELAAMVNQGARVTEFEPESGDPSDPDYCLFSVSLYDNIEINGVPDELFRINF